MAQYDGSIRINTDITTKSANVQLAALENRMVKTADKVVALRDKMEALRSTKIPTQEYSEISTQIEKANYKLVSLIEKQEQMKAEGKTTGTSWERLTQQIESVNNTINHAKSELQDLIDTGKAFTLGSSTEEYSRIGQQLQYAENELAVLNQRHDILIEKTSSTESSYVRLGDSVKNAFRMIGKGLIDIPIAVVKKGASGLLSIFSRLGNMIKSNVSGAFKRLESIAKSVFAKITQHANKSSGVLSNFAGRVKNLVVSFLIFNQIRKILSSTVNAIKAGFTNLYEENARFKSSVDNLKASVLTLKNALATAFAPIVEMAIPYIQMLVEWLTKAADSVGQLMAAIAGRKTYTRAIKQTTAALKEETKASNKQLSSLDKLNNLTTSQSGDNADTGTGGMFEEVTISDKWKNIAQWLKDMWENSDFYELGKLLGEKLKNALDSIPWDVIKNTARKIGKSLASLINGFIEVEGLGYSIGKTLIEAINTGFEFLNAFVHELHWESVGKFIAETINGFFQNIDWPLIYDTLVTAAAGLGNAINSFVDVLDWETIANAVSNFFNTLIDTVYVFITTTDWVALATNLGKTISDAFNGIDWAKAGQTVGEAFKAFFSFITTTIENIDWWAVGESVKDFLVGIDWAGVAEAFFEAVGAAIGGLAAFLGGLIAEGVVEAKEYFQDKIEEAGGNVVEGILVGIAEALVNIGNWIKEHIFTPFMDGFKKAFEINSPSKVMEGMGGFIVSGLLEGLKEKWKDVVDWITSKIQWLKEKVGSMAGSVAGVFGGKKSTVSYSISHMTEPISPVVAALSNVEIPAYATGQVIPRTMKQHLALLGDNTQETEVVSPLSTMKQALVEALVEAGVVGGSNEGGDIVINIDGREVFRVTQKHAREYKKRTRKPAFG